jgi:YD repeat-containing protein
MKIKIITICFFLVLMIISCKKEDLSNGLSNGNPTPSYVAIVSKVLTDNLCSSEYVYNDSNLVVQEKTKYDFTTHHYNSKGQLATTDYYGNDDILSSDLQVFQTAINKVDWVTPANGKKGGTITYTYDNSGKLTKSTNLTPSSSTTEYSDFTYNSSNKISRQTMYWGSSATGYIDYSYDGSGNLVKEMLYNIPATGVAELITTTVYAFDNNSNPFRYTGKLPIPGINTNANNIVKVTYTIHVTPDQGGDKVQISQTTYQYNGMGYPISKNGNITYSYK